MDCPPLNKIFALKRPLFVVDTETTGLDVQNDRIVEFGLQQWTSEGLIKEWRSLVNPEILIPEQATKSHKITNALLNACQVCKLPILRSEMLEESDGRERCRCETPKPVPTFRQLAESLARGMTNCDFAGKNVRFDLRIIAAEMARVRVEWSYLGARILDNDRIEALANPRSLSHLYEKYTGQKHEDAHTALADVQASSVVLYYQMQQHPTLSRDLDTLHELQWPGWIDGEGKFQFVNGVPCFSRWGKYSGQPMANADRGYWDFILSNSFSLDVKALAREAKLGRFPQPITKEQTTNER